MSVAFQPDPRAPSALSSLPESELRRLQALTAGSRNWQASLACTFQRRAERTVLARRMHEGPLLVQRPFYPEGPSPCHLYLIHPPGGVAGGDKLTLRADLEAGAHALITTPAATKLYRSGGREAIVENLFTVADGAVLEWLPQETLAFSDAHVRLATRVDIQGRGRFVGWEVVGLGRPASGEKFTLGSLRQRFEVYRDGNPLFLERSVIEGDDAVLHAAWGLSENPVFATMVITADAPQALLDAVRGRITCDAPGRFAMTALSGVVVCRYIGPWAEAARHHLSAVWHQLRPTLLGMPAAPPRIWAT